MSKGWKADRFGGPAHNDQAAAIAPSVRVGKPDKFVSYVGPPPPAPVATAATGKGKKRGKAK